MDKKFDLQVQADRDLVSREKASERILEIRVQAPEAGKKTQRVPLNLALVLDRSGSMSGGKLEAVKQAAMHVLDLMQAQDKAAVVAYDDQINVLAPSMNVTDANRNELKRRIAPLRPGGSTNLGDGWLVGCRQVAEGMQSGSLCRALLLTDGLANVGVTDPEALATQARELFSHGVSTSTFGVGEGFNEHLLEAMANLGGGNFYFIETQQDIPGLFLREFKELAEITARDVEIEVEYPASIDIKVLGGWRADCPQPGVLRIMLGGFTSGRQQGIYLKLVVPANADLTSLDLRVTVRGKGEGNSLLELSSQVTFRYAGQAEADAQQSDQPLMERYAQVQVAEAANEALKMERRGERVAAERHLRGTVQGTLRYMSSAAAQDYNNMADRMAMGMDELDRKRSHYQTYNAKQQRMVGREFPLERPTGHVVIDIHGVKALLDTGSPVSIGELSGWSFQGEPVNLLPSFQGLNTDYLTRQVGTRIDVLLGVDVLGHYHLVIDDSRGMVVFGRDSLHLRGNRIPLRDVLMGVPAADLVVGGETMPLYVDTGARFSYLPAEFLKGYQPVGREHDFFPGMGEFETPIYKVAIEVGGEIFETSCGVLPPVLEMAVQASGVKGVLGMELLKDYLLELNLPEWEMRLQPR